MARRRIVSKRRKGRTHRNYTDAGLAKRKRGRWVSKRKNSRYKYLVKTKRKHRRKQRGLFD